MNNPLRSNSAMLSKFDQLVFKRGLGKRVVKSLESDRKACRPYNDVLVPFRAITIREVADSWPGNGALHDKIPCSGSVLDCGRVPR